MAGPRAPATRPRWPAPPPVLSPAPSPPARDPVSLPGRRALTAWLALLAVVGLGAAVAVAQLRVSRALVERACQVPGQTGDLPRVLLDAETG